MTRRRPPLTVIPLALAALVASAGLASAAAPLALPDHGGATRNDGDRSAEVAAAVDGGSARNVILLIGDGMGDSEITSARNYEYGAAGRLPGIDALPLTGSYTTYSLTRDGEPDYTPDSASTATAFASGTKSYDGAISVDIEGTPQRNLLELAKAQGLRTGNVSTAYIQDATPASQTAHVGARGCGGPVDTSADCPEDALENGGLGSITEQLIGTRADVTLGGGAATFDEVAAAGRWEGETLLDQATDRGYQLVDDLASLQAVSSADQDTPLLGLFSPDTMPVRWVGPEATPEGGAAEPQRCEANPDRLDSQPTLQQMTDKALDLLATDEGTGFFLQVEGASIDKQNHGANACGQIGEMIDLDEAVQSAMEFAIADGNTSVFVTADHAHTSQIIEAGSTTPGLTTTLLTNEGQPMTINYATSEAAGSQQHTGTQLRVAGYGPQAANVVGLTDQTDLFFTIAGALELPEDPAVLSADADLTLPASSRAGTPLPVDGMSFFGDFAVQLTATQAGRTVDLGEVPVYAGTIASDATTPDRVGSWTITATGVQSGQELTQRLRVSPSRGR